MRYSDGRLLLTAAGVALLTALPPQNTSNPPPSGGTNAEFAAAAMGLPEDYNDEVFIDENIRADMDSIKQYMARSDADVVSVVSNGNWEDDSSWYNVNTGTQRSPRAGEKVLIALGTIINYRSNSLVEIENIRADGQMIFARDRNTKLVFDTIFVDHTGYLEAGTEANPIPDTFSCDFVVTDNGPIETTNDPLKMHRGILSYGPISMHGAAKTPYAQLAANVDAGATTFDLQEVPSGWKNGDTLIVLGSRMRGIYNDAFNGWEDDERTFVSNAGATVTINSGLTFDHHAGHLDPTALTHVANMTRSVKIYMRDGEATPNQRRGHNLFKNFNADIRYVEVRSMGRTDQNLEQLKQDNGNIGSWGDYIPVRAAKFVKGGGTIDADLNTAGRYGLHWHRIGANDPLIPTGICIGNTVRDVIGWGIVHHDSHTNMNWNIVYDYQGAGMVLEGGGAFGDWENNLTSSCRDYIKYASVADVKDGRDDGAMGMGYFMNSRIADLRNNWAANTNAGFAWTTRPNQETEAYPGVVEFPSRIFPGQDVNGGGTVRRDSPPLGANENNSAYCCELPFVVVKSSPAQHHSQRSIIKNFKAWECGKEGMHLQYTGGYTLIDPHVMGHDWENHVRTIKPDIAYRIHRVAVNVVLVRPIADHWNWGTYYAPDGSGPSIQTDTRHMLIDKDFRSLRNGPYRNFSGDTFTPPWGPTPSNDSVLEFTSGDLNLSETVRYEPRDPQWTPGDDYGDLGDIIDEIGRFNRHVGVNSDTGLKFLSQADLNAGNYTGKTLDGGFFSSMRSDEVPECIRINGYYTDATHGFVLSKPDIISSALTGDHVLFQSPIRLNVTQSYLDSINAQDMGQLPAEQVAILDAATFV